MCHLFNNKVISGMIDERITHRDNIGNEADENSPVKEKVLKSGGNKSKKTASGISILNTEQLF